MNDICYWHSYIYCESFQFFLELSTFRDVHRWSPSYIRTKVKLFSCSCKHIGWNEWTKILGEAKFITLFDPSVNRILGQSHPMKLLNTSAIVAFHNFNVCHQLDDVVAKKGSIFFQKNCITTATFVEPQNFDSETVGSKEMVWSHEHHAFWHITLISFCFLG